MPRGARLVIPGVPMHMVQRGHNRAACFGAPEDFQVYRRLLSDHASRSGCEIHAYALMTNHVHLLVTPKTTCAPGRLMKRVGQSYVQHFNRRYMRSGTLWEGRFRSCVCQHESYVLACHRYIELNPVRAGIVSHPGAYPWSSFRANAEGQTDPVTQTHALLESLSDDPHTRRRFYRDLFQTELDPDVLMQIRHATDGNRDLGVRLLTALR